MSGWVVAWIAASNKFAFRTEVVFSVTFLFGITGVVAGAWLFVRGFQLLQSKRWIEDMPVTKIAGAAIGQVKVFGRATGPYTLLSPLASVDCYYYRAVAGDGRNAQNSEKPPGRATETLFTPFFVEDETGRLMIDPRGANLDLPFEYDEVVSGMSMSECARRFLRRHGLSIGEPTTLTESAIKPGDPLLVLGTLMENRGLGSMADAEKRDSRDAYLSREAADLQRLGQLEAMGAPSGEMPDSATTTSCDFDLHPPLLLGKGKRQPFVVSREHPQSMINDLARRSVLDIWVGPILALFSLGLVLKWARVW